MHTELCDRLGIEFPIFAFSHCRDVVAAHQYTTADYWSGPLDWPG